MSDSLGGSSVLQSFLISIGYQIDRGSEERAKAALVSVAKEAAALGAALAATAVAVTAAVAKIASEMESLYVSAARSGTAVESLREMQFAFSQIGLSAGQARNTVETLAAAIRTNPGNEGLIQSLGVNTRNANGALRDTTAIYGDLIGKLKEMPYQQGNYFAGALGIDEKTFYQATHEVDSFSAVYRSMAKAAGLDNDAAAKSARGFMIELRTLGAAVGILQDRVASAFTRHMTEDIRRFREFLVSNFGTINRAITWVADKLLAAADVVATLAKRTVEAVQDIAGWYMHLSDTGKILVDTFGLLLVAWRGLNLAFLVSPIGIIVGLGAAILGLYDDYKTWKEGGQSLIDWAVWEPQIKGAWTEISKLGETITGTLIPAFKSLLGDIPDQFKQFFQLDLPSFIRTSIAEIQGVTAWLTKMARVGAALAHGNWAEAAAIMGSDTDPASAQQGAMRGQFDQATGGGGPTTLDRLRNLFTGEMYPGQGETPGARFGDRFGYVFSGMDIDKTKAAKEAFDFWTGKGFTPAGASAMVAAEHKESGFNPNARGDGGEAHGLFQHHGDRRARIMAATGIDMSHATAMQQREGMYQEMALGLDRQAGQAFNIIRNASSPQVASDANVNLVERPRDRQLNMLSRGAVAADVQRRFAGGAAASSALPTTVADMERIRGLMPGALRSLEIPTPLLSGDTNNTTTHGPTLQQTNNITVTGGGPDVAEQIVRGVRTENQNAVRNLVGAAR